MYFCFAPIEWYLDTLKGHNSKSIARVQTHFSSLDVGPAAKPEIRPNLLYSKRKENRAWSQVTAAKIIFLEFAQLSLLSSYVFDWVLSFLSVDLGGTSSVSHDQFRIWLGAKGQQGVGFPGRIFRLLSRFCLILWTFSQFLTSNRFLKAYLLWDVNPRCTAQGTDPSVGPLSPQSKTLTCSDGAVCTCLKHFCD